MKNSIKSSFQHWLSVEQSSEKMKSIKSWRYFPFIKYNRLAPGLDRQASISSWHSCYTRLSNKKKRRNTDHNFLLRHHPGRITCSCTARCHSFDGWIFHWIGSQRWNWKLEILQVSAPMNARSWNWKTWSFYMLRETWNVWAFHTNEWNRGYTFQSTSFAFLFESCQTFL